MSRVVLVDANGLSHRIWWANPIDVPARFERAARKIAPSGYDIVACWDGVGSWRREIFPAYKSGRPPKPKELSQSLLDCRRVFSSLAVDLYEADDLIATLARQTEAEGGIPIVFSDDKDLLQCVTQRCLAVNGRGDVLGPEQVERKMGVPPNRIRHYLSWLGDAVDGLPGVAGYGPKRAAAQARLGLIGDQLTYDLTELATVPGVRT